MIKGPLADSAHAYAMNQGHRLAVVVAQEKLRYVL